MTTQPMTQTPDRTATESPLSVAVIVGSVRAPRVGRAVADWIADHAARRTDVTVDLIDLADVDLPLAGTVPGGGAGSPISARLAAADAFVVVTPEYNHSFPAALKNAVDWHYREWQFKPVAFTCYGAGAGGTRAVEQLRVVFGELHAVTIRRGVVLRAPWESVGADGTFAADGPARDAATATLDELTWWAAALRTARADRPLPV